MATNKSTATRTESPAIRRDRRETMVDEHFARITLQLRALATTATPIEQARRIRDRYARTVGARAGAGGDLLIAYLTSDAAAEADIEEIDHLFFKLGKVTAEICAGVEARERAAAVIATAICASATASGDAARAISRARKGSR